MAWNRSAFFIKRYISLFCLIALLVSAVPAHAQKKADDGDKEKTKVSQEMERFLKALTESGFHDVGIYYLEKNRAILPDTIKDTFDYQMGLLRLERARQITENELQLQEMDKAAEDFLKFLKEHPDHAKVNDVRSQYPQIIVGKANYFITLAKMATTPEAMKKQLLEDARKELDKAVQFLNGEDQKVTAENKKYATEREALEAKYKKLQQEQAKKTNDPNARIQIPKPDQDRLKELSDLGQATSDIALFMRFLRANIIYEQANSYEAGSKERNDKLEEARKQYASFWEKYAEEEVLVAYQGRLREAQILIEQKKINGKGEARDILKDLTTVLDDTPGIVDVYSAALTAYFSCFFETKPDDGQWAGIRASFTKWSRSSDVERTADYCVDLTLAFAKLLGEQAKPLKENDPNRKKLTDEISKLLTPLQRRFPRRAYDINQLLREFVPEAATEQPTVDWDTYRQSKSYEEVMKFATRQMRGFIDKQNEWSRTTDQAKKDALKLELTKLARELLPVQEHLETLKASMLTEPSKTVHLLAQRYNRGVLLNAIDRQLDATVVFGMIAFKYPQDARANASLDIMSQLYAVMLDRRVREMIRAQKGMEEIREAVQFELNSMARVAETYAAKRNLRVADKTKVELGWQRLCAACVAVGDMQGAKKYLNNISETSTFRPDVEGTVGGAIWKTYNENSRAELAKRLYNDEQAAGLRQDALELLDSSFQKQQEAVKKGKSVTPQMVGSMVRLCEIYNQAGQMNKTLEVLQNPTIGPYTLLAANSPAVGPYKQNILSTALQAFVSENQSDEAEKVMDQLEALAAAEVGSGASSDDRLTNMYIKLGRGLEESLQQMKAEDDSAMVDKVQQGFEIFLDRIRTREAKYSTLMWIAQTYLSLGDGLMESKGRKKSTPAAAKRYFGLAAETYTRIIGLCENDPAFCGVTNEAALNSRLTSLKQRLAQCLIKAGNNDDGLNIYALILLDAPNRFDEQVEAAEVMWGIAQSLEVETKDKEEELKRRIQAYTDAMNGKFDELVNEKTKQKENVLYGWSKLNKLTKNYAPDWDEDAPTRLRQEKLTKPMYDKRHQQQYLSVLRKSQVGLELARIYDEAVKTNTKLYRDAKKKKPIDCAQQVQENLKTARANIESVYKLYAVASDGTEVEGALAGMYDAFDETYREILTMQRVPKDQILGLKGIKTFIIDPKALDEREPLIDTVVEKDEGEKIAIAIALENESAEILKKGFEEQAEPPSQVVLYTSIGAGALIALIVLYFILRRPKPSVTELHRREELAETELTELPSGETAEEFLRPVKIEGVTDGEVAVPMDASTDVFASLGIGDAPAANVDSDVKIDFFASPEEKKAAAAQAAASQPASRPAKKPAPAANGQNGEKRPVKKVAPKPAEKPAENTSAETPAEDAPKKPAIKPVIKPVVKKTETAENTKPDEKPADTPVSDEPAGQPADKSDSDEFKLDDDT